MLRVEPEGAATVQILSPTSDDRWTWNGKGEFELAGLEVGTYRTKVTPVKGLAERGVIEVKDGQRCSLSADALKGGEWSPASCE